MRGIAVRSRTEEDTRDRGEVFFFVFLFLARSHGFRQPFLFSFHFVVCELKKKRRWNCFCASERVRDGRGMVPFVFCFSFLFQTESKSFLSGGIFAIVSLFCFFFTSTAPGGRLFPSFWVFFSVQTQTRRRRRRRRRCRRRRRRRRSRRGGMDAHVPVEVARLREAQQTEFALVRFLAAVDAHVLRQRRGIGEGLRPTTNVNNFF